MPLQLIKLSHEPAVVFVVLSLLSLVASYILFKLLDSRATIKRKGWSAGGAIAGFLLILFGSWYALKPSLSIQTPVMPLSIPTDFKAVSVSDAGVAIAIPPHWERKDDPITLRFEPKTQEPNSEDAKILFMRIQPCKELCPMTSGADLSQDNDALKEIFGLLRQRSASINDPYLGHKGSSTPVSVVIPGKWLEPTRSKDFSINLIMRQIYDERDSRCIAFMYPDTELGRQLSSTFNIASPSP
jgi:hypothetical protein